MNDARLLKEAEQEFSALHFYKSLDLLEDLEKKDNAGALILKSRIYGALADFDRLQETREQLQHFEDPKSRAACLQADYVLQQLETPLALDEAQVLSEMKTADDPVPFLSMLYTRALALLDAGEVYEAKQLLDRLEKQARALLDLKNESSLRFYLNILMSLGDACTFLEQETRAERLYLQAIRLCDQLDADSGFSELRKALFYNNLADLYEQMEQMEQAFETYEKGMECMNASLRYPYDDAYSYVCTLLNSFGNFCSNLQEYEQAEQLLTHSEKLLAAHWKEIINPAALQAKNTYYQGLAALYQLHSDRAIALLYEAYCLQEELIERKLEKELELARTAYYLSYIEQDDKQAERMARKALDLFLVHHEKDRHFYTGAIADLYNQLGLLSKKPEEGRNLLEEALEWNRRGLREYPEDDQFVSSMLSVYLNLAALAAQHMSERSLYFKGREVLEDVLFLRLHGVIKKEEYLHFLHAFFDRLAAAQREDLERGLAGWLITRLEENSLEEDAADYLLQSLTKEPENLT